MPISYSLSLAAIAPFCGYLQDLFGRRRVALAGGTALFIRCLIVDTAQGAGQAIAGMAITGGGAAIGELTALAGTSELVPVNKRAFYLALVTLFCATLLPVVDVHLAAWSLPHVAMEYVDLLVSAFDKPSVRPLLSTDDLDRIYNGVAIAGIATFHSPQSRFRGRDVSAYHILKKTDYVGAFLSVVGLTLLYVSAIP